MKDHLRLFRSVRFNILLLFVIAAASAAGTVLPQAADAPDAARAWVLAHPALGRVFEGLGLFGLYGSWWYIGLLALLAFDIVVCKLLSAPPDSGLVESRPLRAEFTVGRGVQETVGRMTEILGKEGYKQEQPKKQAEAGASVIVFERLHLQRWGSFLTHAALVMILGGGLVKQLFGFAEMVPVVSGGSSVMRHRGWELKVDGFTVEYYPGTRQPRLFSSDLKVYHEGKLLGSKVIKVNQPLDVGGVRFYQASWGASGAVDSVTLDIGGRKVRVRGGEPAALAGGKIRVVADGIAPDFTIGPDGRADTRSLEPRNLAVRFLLSTPGRPSRALWLVGGEPAAAFTELDDGTLAEAPAPPFRLAEIEPVLFSGIQAAYDPGFKLVAGGSVCWLAGLLLLFGLHRRRIWLAAAPGERGGTRVLAGAWSSRGPREFEPEFERLVAGWSAALEG